MIRRESVRHGLAAPLVAATAAVFMAAPWLDQRLVWAAWIGLAIPLACVERIRGWWGECWTLVGATAAIAIAFHWTPEALAYAMDADSATGIAIATPIVFWDALRLAAPLLFAARVQPDPLRAWLPAGLLAFAIEAVAPAVFPWRLGYAQGAWPILVQSVDLVGPELSTLVLYAHAGLLVWLAQTGWRRPIPRAVAVAVAVCAANLAYGSWAIALWTQVAATSPTFGVVLVQANPEAEGGVDALRGLTRLAHTASLGATSLVCWPECSGGCYAESLTSLADPECVLENSRPPRAGMRPLDELASPLLFGGKSYRGHPEKPHVLHQSAILVDRGHTIRGRYHKRHLMPFGEYVPGEDVYPDIKRYFPMQEAFAAGVEANVLACGSGVRIGVMMCYEDMIPEAARSLVANGANLLVSLINGAAFTSRLTLEQHRMLARLRAVETRRCLLRCAATGETCVIAPTGTITASLPLHVHGVLAAQAPLVEGRTLASRLGRLFPACCGLGAAAVAWRRRRPATG
ncbi:MAG: apolipoprotein N-acyltransferase [Planctomycetaceae bacterium]